MKTHKLISLLFAFCLGGFAQSAMVQLWDFNDANNTALDFTSNTGTLGTSWDFGLGNPDQGLTNGSAFEFNRVASGGPINTDYTRKATFSGTPITTGTYTFEYRMSGWDMSGADALNGTNDQEGITIKLGDQTTSNRINLIFALTGSGGNIRTRHATTGLGGTAAQNNIALTSGIGDYVTVRVEGNLDTGAFTTSFDEGSGFNTLISDGTGLTSLGEIQIAVEGDQGGWAVDDYMELDYVSLTSIPEPSSILLLGVALAGLLMFHRRK